MLRDGRTHRPYLYELCGVLLKTVLQERYLGVVISQSLSWSIHISQVRVKANQKIGFIKRNLKGSPQELKRLAYITLVRSGMEYASPVWDPSTSKDQDALERIQRRAARWITSSYDRTTSVTNFLRTQAGTIGQAQTYLPSHLLVQGVKRARGGAAG